MVQPLTPKPVANPADVAVVDRCIPARDGFSLAGNVFRDGDSARCVAIINSATAVPRRFYRHYAAALAKAGYVAVTYDYRGIGGSRPKSLRGFQARIRDWGLMDMAGVVDWVHAEFNPQKVFLIGHSVGGQVAGLLENSSSIDGMLTVSAQSGYWRLQGGEQKAVVALHVHVTLPLLATTLGYMPWSWIGSAEDLPKHAALEWSRWCRDPRYLLGDATLPLERYKDFAAPVLAYSIDDDKWGTKRAVDAMMSAYPNLERRHIEPKTAGLSSLGHVGYFRKESERLWQDGFSWLDSL